MNRDKLKSQAKQQISGNLGTLFLITLIVFAISWVAAMIPMGGMIASLILTPAFSISIIRVYLNLTKNIKPSVDDAFKGFDDFWSAFKLNFLIGLFTFLWSLLFIVPGIIKSYSYSLSMYILSENKNKPALECIKESEKMTEGHKMDLFVLGLSFFGWILLTILTFGIAIIWVGPYMNATYSNAYNHLKVGIEKGEKKVNNAIQSSNINTRVFCNECGEQIVSESKFCNNCGCKIERSNKYSVCIFDVATHTLRKEIRDIDIEKFPPSKFAYNDTYYAIETFRDGKKVRIYHTKDNWNKQIEIVISEEEK